MDTQLTGPQIATQIVEDWTDRYVNHKASASNLVEVLRLVANAHANCGDDDLEDAVWSAYDGLRSTCEDRDLIWTARNHYRHLVAGI